MAGEQSNLSDAALWQQKSAITLQRFSISDVVLASVGKMSKIIFQQIIITAVWEETRLPHVFLALFSGFRKWQETAGLCGEKAYLLTAL